MMRFEKPRCPVCGEEPASILEMLLAHAWVSKADAHEGEPLWDYAGESDILWDTQEPLEREGKVRLYCSAGHDWETRMTLVQPGTEKPE